MTNKLFNWTTTACIFSLSIFSLLSAQEIRQLRQNYNNISAVLIQTQKEVIDLNAQIQELSVQEYIEPEMEIIPAVELPQINYDYDYVLRVVAAESRGESLEGQMAVAQVIQERAIARDMTPEEVVKEKYQFAAPVSMDLVNESVVEACERVFINGEKITEHPIKYFYSTVGGFVSSSHEKKTYVMTIGNHKFFMD